MRYSRKALEVDEMVLVYNTAMIAASRKGSYSFQMICVLFGGIVLPLLHEVIFLGGTLTAIQALAIGMMLVSFALYSARYFVMLKKGGGNAEAAGDAEGADGKGTAEAAGEAGAPEDIRGTEESEKPGSPEA